MSERDRSAAALVAESERKSSLDAVAEFIDEPQSVMLCVLKVRLARAIAKYHALTWDAQ